MVVLGPVRAADIGELRQIVSAKNQLTVWAIEVGFSNLVQNLLFGYLAQCLIILCYSLSPSHGRDSSEVGCGASLKPASQERVN